VEVQHKMGFDLNRVGIQKKPNARTSKNWRNDGTVEDEESEPEVRNRRNSAGDRRGSRSGSRPGSGLGLSGDRERDRERPGSGMGYRDRPRDRPGSAGFHRSGSAADKYRLDRDRGSNRRENRPASSLGIHHSRTGSAGGSRDRSASGGVRNRSDSGGRRSSLSAEVDNKARDQKESKRKSKHGRHRSHSIEGDLPVIEDEPSERPKLKLYSNRRGSTGGGIVSQQRFAKGPDESGGFLNGRGAGRGKRLSSSSSTLTQTISAN